MDKLLTNMPGPIQEQMAKRAAKAEAAKYSGEPGWKLFFNENSGTLFW